MDQEHGGYGDKGEAKSFSSLPERLAPGSDFPFLAEVASRAL